MTGAASWLTVEEGARWVRGWIDQREGPFVEVHPDNIRSVAELLDATAARLAKAREVLREVDALSCRDWCAATDPEPGPCTCGRAAWRTAIEGGS